jgi:hypothetical protein
MKVKYGDRKIPDKVLTSIEDKAAKAAKSTAPLIATARAESRKRKGGDDPKDVAKEEEVFEGFQRLCYRGNGRECLRWFYCGTSGCGGFRHSYG